MISVLIPVYNVDVTELVNQLSLQLQELNKEGELIILDDFSDEKIRQVNRSLSSKPKVIYNELEKNYGRVEIRKKLAEKAAFNWLLFIDSDSKIISSHFLKNYLDLVNQDYDVVAGGTQYEGSIPECNKRLHWKYGKEREVVTKHKKSFRTNNFCIKKNVFQKINFPVELNGYGHEDTWIGIELDKLNAKIAYTKNPVLHIGIEENETFISKSLNALQNLKILSGKVDQTVLERHVKLYRVYVQCKRFGIKSLVSFAHSIFKKQVYKNLTSCTPSLKLFDFFRLANFISIMKQDRR